MTPLLILLLVYSVALVATGAWIGRSVRKSEDFFVGGRSLGAGALFATFMAANIGAASTVNATGLAYHHGLAAWWWNGAAGIGTLVLAFWVGPRIWTLATARGYLTVGDFLDDHFGRTVRLVATSVIWFGSLSIFAAQIIGASAVLQIAGGVSKTTGALIAVGVMTAYFALGGLLSSAWVNRVQLIVILAGFAMAVAFTIGRAGGVDVVSAAVPGTTFFTGISPAAGWPLLFLVAPNFFLSPGLVQRAFAARSVSALRTGVGWCAVALLVFAFAPVALGMSARLLLPDMSAEPLQMILPTLLAEAVPTLVGALALAAVFSAEISSADAVLYMLSTSGARDIYRGVFKPNATDAELLRAARVTAVLGGVGGFVLVFYYDSIYAALGAFYSVVGVTLLAPVLGGLFLPRGGRPAALTSIIVGIAVLYGSPGYLPASAWLTSSLACLTASAAAYLAVAASRRT
jgi:SSS family solute:Na+ symporter